MDNVTVTHEIIIKGSQVTVDGKHIKVYQFYIDDQLVDMSIDKLITCTWYNVAYIVGPDPKQAEDYLLLEAGGNVIITPLDQI